MSELQLKVSRLKLFEKDKMRAFADLTINDCYAVKGFKVFEGVKGLFVSMPSKSDGGGKYDDIFHPITKEAYAELQKLVLEAYEKAKIEGEPASTSSGPVRESSPASSPEGPDDDLPF